VRADLSDPDTLHACLEGAEAVFLVWPFLTADSAAAVLDAITRHARRMVYLSSLGVRDDQKRHRSDQPVARRHRASDRADRAGVDFPASQWVRDQCFVVGAADPR
jgi:uncharacterized protein YbjT (DUF2867 family)